MQYHALRPTVLEAAEARDLATLLWAHAELGLSPPALFRGLGARLVHPAVLAVSNEQVSSVDTLVVSPIEFSFDLCCFLMKFSHEI